MNNHEKNISLVAAFMGVKYIPPPFVIGSNNANPKLILKADSIEYRNLFSTSTKAYKDIEKVDIYINNKKFLGVETTNIILVFSNSHFTFIGNLNSLNALQNLVNILREKGCSLSVNAEKLLRKNDT